MEQMYDIPMDDTLLDGENIGTNIEDNDNGTLNGGLNCYVDEISLKVEKLERRLNDVERYYSNKKPLNTSKASSTKDKDKDRRIFSVKKQQLEASRRAAAAAKRMQELMRQFATILRQITQNKWAWPFLQPVDVEGLGLHDYYKVIDKPMDLSTIKNQMEAMDGTGYKSVRDIFTDSRLVFKNAMKYNDDRSDVHVMAKALLEKLEEKWLPLLPKVIEEEERLKEEEIQAMLDMNFTQEAIHAKIARDLSSELDDVEMYLEELRERVVQKCRKMTIEDKRKLGTALSKLSSDDLSKALEIVAQGSPNFQAAAEEVELDMDTLSEITLWRLKLFVKDALDVHANNINDDDDTTRNKNNDDKRTVDSSKRRGEISQALAKTARKRTKGRTIGSTS